MYIWDFKGDTSVDDLVKCAVWHFECMRQRLRASYFFHQKSYTVLTEINLDGVKPVWFTACKLA
jgi:hypothetical protein